MRCGGEVAGDCDDELSSTDHAVHRWSLAGGMRAGDGGPGSDCSRRELRTGAEPNAAATAGDAGRGESANRSATSGVSNYRDTAFVHQDEGVSG